MIISKNGIFMAVCVLSLNSSYENSEITFLGSVDLSGTLNIYISRGSYSDFTHPYANKQINKQQQN